MRGSVPLLEEESTTRKRSAICIAATAASLIVGMEAPAFAATWTVTPGGAVTGTAGTTILKDTRSGATLNCASSTTAATVQSGSGLSGTAIATVTSASFTNCSGPLGLQFNVSAPNVAYQLNAVSYSAGVTTGTLANISATLSGPFCTASVGGATASTPGTVNGTYNNATGTLSVTGGNLHTWNVSGCFGLLRSGDPVSYTASYVLSPIQTITSP